MEFTDICPTVQVVSDVAPGGFIVINESDLTDEHVIFGEAEKPKRGRKAKGTDDVQTDDKTAQEPASE